MEPFGRITKYPVPDSFVQRVSLAPVCVIESSDKGVMLGGTVSTTSILLVTKATLETVD
jgi:hypothetical protein